MKAEEKGGERGTPKRDIARAIAGDEPGVLRIANVVRGCRGE